MPGRANNAAIDQASRAEPARELQSGIRRGPTVIGSRDPTPGTQRPTRVDRANSRLGAELRGQKVHHALAQITQRRVGRIDPKRRDRHQRGVRPDPRPTPRVRQEGECYCQRRAGSHGHRHESSTWDSPGGGDGDRVVALACPQSGKGIAERTGGRKSISRHFRQRAQHDRFQAGSDRLAHGPKRRHRIHRVPGQDGLRRRAR